MFRRSSYCAALDASLINSTHASSNSNLYPINPLGAILTKNVVVFRGEEDDGYPFLSKPFSVDCLAVAGMDSPPTRDDKMPGS